MRPIPEDFPVETMKVDFNDPEPVIEMRERRQANDS